MRIFFFFFCDNRVVIFVVHNPILHYRTIHTFYKEEIEAGAICIPYLPTTKQIVDILNKWTFKEAVSQTS